MPINESQSALADWSVRKMLIAEPGKWIVGGAPSIESPDPLDRTRLECGLPTSCAFLGGDGMHDDSRALQELLDASAAGNHALFLFSTNVHRLSEPCPKKP
jgi:hypothetical protein